MGTNSIPELLQGLPPAQAWHGLNSWHLLVTVVIGWLTHANWPKILDAYQWIKNEGGWLRILISVTWNKTNNNNSNHETK